MTVKVCVTKVCIRAASISVPNRNYHSPLLRRSKPASCTNMSSWYLAATPFTGSIKTTSRRLMHVEDCVKRFQCVTITRSLQRRPMSAGCIRPIQGHRLISPECRRHSQIKTFQMFRPVQQIRTLLKGHRTIMSFTASPMLPSSKTRLM